MIEKSALPSRSMIMGQNPNVRIVDNLGHDSHWMLQIYLMVQKVVRDEIMYGFQSTSSDSPLGEVEDWSNHLGSSLLDQALKIEQSVCEAAYQMTPSFPGLGQGRCKCGAIKSLKFKWKEPIPQYSSGGVSNIILCQTALSMILRNHVLTLFGKHYRSIVRH